MKIDRLPIDKLRAADYNPRKDLTPDDAEYQKLKRSIEHFGYVEPVIVNDRTGLVVGGHQRLKVLKDLGYTDIEVVHVDLDTNDEKALNIALNKISGQWDADKLEDILRELNLADDFDVELSGFELGELDTLLNGSVDETKKHGTHDGPTKDDVNKALDELCKEADQALHNQRDIKEGDIYQCGNHKIICGDSYNPETYKRLVGDEQVTMIFTDPPYQFTGNEHRTKIFDGTEYNALAQKKLYSQGMNQFSTKNIEYLFKLGIKSMYFCCSRDSVLEYLNLAVEHNYKYDIHVLYKNQTMPLHSGSYLNDIEYVLYFRLPQAVFNGKLGGAYYHHLVDEPTPDEIVEKQFYSKVYRTVTSEGKKETANELDYELTHPTVKPLRLLIPRISISSNPGDLVVDMFSGSGTTMIACEKLDRRCFTCEKLPEYVNETIDRWEALTKQKAVKLN